MKKVLSLTLVIICILGCALPVSAAGGFHNLQKAAEYAGGLFDDVPEDAWFRDSVAAVYELGLMNGAGDGSFRAGGDVRVSEAVVLAARLHSLYRTGEMRFAEPREGAPWYMPYVEYAVENGVLSEAPEDYDAAASRARFAAMMGRALPAEALPAINDVADGQLPDVKMSMEGAAEIYRLYRAGVLTGNNSRGSFAPESPIDRAAVAAVVSRMAYRSLRQKFVLLEPEYPDLTGMPEAEDGFFADAAMLGNSLVEGMQLYSGLSLDYYGGTSMTVFRNKLSDLLKKQYGKVYIEFGINEISYNTETVMEEYGRIIDKIRAAMPDADIYAMAVTPVTKARSDQGAFTMRRIDDFNAALRALCAEKKCWYLDCCAPLEGDDGYLISDYAGWDGSPHLAVAGYRAWADVIRTHYA